MKLKVITTLEKRGTAGSREKAVQRENTRYEIIAINPNNQLSVITINVNGQNCPLKNTENITLENIIIPDTLFIRDLLDSKDAKGQKIEVMQKDRTGKHQNNNNNKNPNVLLLISNK